MDEANAAMTFFYAGFAAGGLLGAGTVSVFFILGIMGGPSKG